MRTRTCSHFKAKVDAGADGAITQYFYNADAYFRFVDDARAMGITVPIVPGIMPIANFTQLRASPTRAARRFRAGSAKRMQATATTRNRSVSSRPMSLPAVRTPDRRRRAGAAFLHAQSRQGDALRDRTDGLILRSAHRVLASGHAQVAFSRIWSRGDAAGVVCAGASGGTIRPPLHRRAGRDRFLRRRLRNSRAGRCAVVIVLARPRAGERSRR